MKKINKILIGTHNEGKYKEISALLPKELKKFLQLNLELNLQRKQEKHLKIIQS